MTQRPTLQRPNAPTPERPNAPTLLYQVEFAGRYATLYVNRPITASDAETLLRVCSVLPQAVQMLCVSVPDVSYLGDSAPTIIHDIRRHWQATRAGAFRFADACVVDERADSGEMAVVG
jgi:hypothetical protein